MNKLKTSHTTLRRQSSVVKKNVKIKIFKPSATHSSVLLLPILTGLSCSYLAGIIIVIFIVIFNTQDLLKVH